MIILKDLGTRPVPNDSYRTERWCIAKCEQCGTEKEAKVAGVKRNPDAPCQACSAKNVAEKNRLKAASEFIAKAKEIHGDLFDYSNAVYTKNQEKVEIGCNSCGEVFHQRPADHKRGAGCPHCRLKGGWTYSEWEKAGEGKHGYRVYLVECWNDDERFIKVGKTFNKLCRRFSGARNMPYQWKLVQEVEGSARFICELEAALHKAFKTKKYTPMIDFHGKYECYPMEDIEHIKEKLNETR